MRQRRTPVHWVAVLTVLCVSHGPSSFPTVAQDWRLIDVVTSDGWTLSAVLPLAPAAGPPRNSGSGLKSARVAILAGSQQSFQLAAQMLKSRLKDAVADCRVIEWAADSDAAAKAKVNKQLLESAPTIIAATGMAAATAALEAAPTVTVVALLTPHALDVQLPQTDSRRARLVIVAADVAPDAQVDWIRAMHPACTKLAALYSSRTAQGIVELRRAALSRQIELVVISADKDRFPKAIADLEAANCQGVLMLPDAAVYNGANVEHLLLWGLRNRRAVWGFSANVVKAGAFAGQFLDAEAVAHETHDVITKIAGGAGAASLGVVFPRRVSKAVNERTSRMIETPFPASAVPADTQRFGESK